MRRSSRLRRRRFKRASPCLAYGQGAIAEGQAVRYLDRVSESELDTARWVNVVVASTRSPSISLREYLYVDTAAVRGVLAQMDSGIGESETKKSEKKTGGGVKGFAEHTQASGHDLTTTKSLGDALFPGCPRRHLRRVLRHRHRCRRNQHLRRQLVKPLRLRHRRPDRRARPQGRGDRPRSCRGGGHTNHDYLKQTFALQAEGLIDGGADAFLIETSQDLLQTKVAAIA
jgi:hypothetical protein